MRSVIIFFSFPLLCYLDAKGVIFPARFSLLVNEKASSDHGTVLRSHNFSYKLLGFWPTLSYMELPKLSKWFKKTCQEEKDSNHFVKG